MFSMIQIDIVKGNITDKKAIPIAQITNMNFMKDRNKVNGYPVWLVSIYAGSHNHVNRFDNEEEASAFYNDCVAKIDAYYQAMKPPKLPENIENLDISIDNLNYVNRLLEKAGD